MPIDQLDQSELRRIAGERIANGKLPPTTHPRIWGGKGAGEACALCDRPIAASEMQLELHLTAARNRGTGCFASTRTVILYGNASAARDYETEGYAARRCSPTGKDRKSVENYLALRPIPKRAATQTNDRLHG